MMKQYLLKSKKRSSKQVMKQLRKYYATFPASSFSQSNNQHANRTAHPRSGTLRFDQKAITVVQKELEETQKVKVKAAQLYQMIELQKKADEAFTNEMTTKKLAWEEEQKMYETRVGKERGRENEEYEYKKKLQRSRDTDSWEEAKRQHEQRKEEEAKERAAMVKELEELRKKVSLFPMELEKEIKRKVDQEVATTQREAHIQQTLMKQEAEAKIKLAEQRISSLEATITSLLSENKEFKQQLEKATNHIKDIAVSVVEGVRKETSQQARSTADTGTK